MVEAVALVTAQTSGGDGRLATGGQVDVAVGLEALPRKVMMTMTKRVVQMLKPGLAAMVTLKDLVLRPTTTIRMVLIPDLHLAAVVARARNEMMTTKAVLLLDPLLEAMVALWTLVREVTMMTRMVLMLDPMVAPDVLAKKEKKLLMSESHLVAAAIVIRAIMTTKMVTSIRNETIVLDQVQTDWAPCHCGW